MLHVKIRRTRRAAALLAGCLLVPAALGAQAPERTITIPRVERPPRIEDFLTAGLLGPPLTDSAIAATVGVPPSNGSSGDARGLRIGTFAQREPGDGVPVSQPTAAYVSYDDTNLYVVFVSHDDRARVRANIARREDIGDDDQVVVYLDTFHDRQRAYLFATNPLGIQLDGIRSESTGDEDMSFDAVWSSEGRLVDDGYVVRMAIPFRSLRFRRGAEQTWGIGVGRVIQRANEESYWPHLTKRVSGFVPQLATMHGLTRISPGRNIQLTPYSMVARARVFDDDIPGHVNEGDERVGMDGKLVVRNALTLDATINPDFSQVETDDPQVTVNERFEVQFPEKRPFFLENAAYFETPEQLFFPRRIVDPGVGLRATGKLGRWAVGALGINDRAALEAASPDAWIGAFRVLRELGEASHIGLLVTDREFSSSPQFDRMFALDGRWRLGDNWQFVGQVMRNDTREPDGARLGDWAMRADLSYDSRAWEYSAGFKQFGPDFSAPLGFVNRSGYREADFSGQYSFRPDAELVTEFGPELSVNWLWDHATGVLQDRELEAGFSIELLGNTSLDLARIEAYELFDGFGFDLHANEVQVATDWLTWLGFEVSYLWGTAVNHDPVDDMPPFIGRATETEVGMTLRPTTQLRVEQSYVHSSLRTRPTSEHLFTERAVRSKINYQFSRRLSLRTILDYGWEDFNTALVDEDDEREREWAADLLLTYLVRPGTALHVGFTDEHENLRVFGSPPEVGRGRDPDLSVGRQLFVKVSYLLQF